MKWHSLLAPITLLFQSVIESKDQTIKWWWIYKKRNKSLVINQVLFPKSEYNYFAACWKPFNGLLMPKGRNPDSSEWQKRSFVWHRSGPSFLSDPSSQKAPSCSLDSATQNALQFFKSSGFSCACALAQVLCFFWKVHLPNPLFPPTLLTNLSLKTDSVQRPPSLRPSFLPSCF